MIEEYERYLRAPLNEYVQAFCCSGLEDPEISGTYNGILGWLNECLLDKNLDDLHLFKIVKFELCGSFADGTRIKEDELEFDLLAEVSTRIFSFTPSSTCPGYVHQVLASTSYPQQISDCFIHLIKGHLPDCFSVVLENDRVQLRFRGNSPTKIIIDIHPVIMTRFSDSSELHYVIPVSCKQPGHGCWRISHFKTEMNLLRKAKRHHILSFRILKELRRLLLPYGFELYAKYALKTAVCLHECSCTSNSDSDIKHCTLSILDIMCAGYRCRFLNSIVGMINIFNSIESNADTSKKAPYISAVREILREHFDNTSRTLLMLEQLCQPRSPSVFAKEAGHEKSFSTYSEISPNELQASTPVSAQQIFKKMVNTAATTPVYAPEMPVNTPEKPTATAPVMPVNTPEIPTAVAPVMPVNTPEMPTATASVMPVNTPKMPTATAPVMPVNTPEMPTATAPVMPVSVANTPQIPVNLTTTPWMMAKSVSASQIQANPATSPTIATNTASTQNTVSTPQRLLNSATPTWMPFNNATTPQTWTNAPSMGSDAASPLTPTYSSLAPHQPITMSTTNVQPAYDTTQYQIPSQFSAGYPSFPVYMPVNNVFGTSMPRYDVINSCMPGSYASVPGVVHFIPSNIDVVPQYCSYSVPPPQTPWFVW